MQRYHLEVEGIPEYINMLEDAQRQAGQAGRAISDKTLLLFASTAMLTSEGFPLGKRCLGRPGGGRQDMGGVEACLQASPRQGAR